MGKGEMWNWVSNLASLPAVVAVLVVFTACVYYIIRAVTKHVVEPFKLLVSNHLEHDKQDREAQCDAMREVAKELQQQRQSFEVLADRINRG